MCFCMLEAIGEVFPESKYQRCTARFYCNVFNPRSRGQKRLHRKATAVVKKLPLYEVKGRAKKVENGILSYSDLPMNNVPVYVSTMHLYNKIYNIF